MLNILIKDHFRETRLYNARLSVIGVIVVTLIFALILRLAYLQVFAHRHYETLSQANRIKPIPIQPPRGLILDRNGVILAQNYPVYTLEIIPEQVDDMNTLLEELGQIVNLNEADLKNFRKQLRERPRFENLVLRSHLTEEEAARLAVKRTYFSGVELEARLRRHYPLAGLGVHFLGYVGRINEQEQDQIDKAAYRGMEYIGKLGLEASYEKTLLGQVGFEKVETNAHGRSLRILERIAPVAGKNLYLSIDAKLQALAEQTLGKRRGAIIAMEPATGAILAFVSTPTYDPNPFVQGIDPDSYQRLLDDPDKPLINRALNGQYAPGSTIKAFLGLAALEQDGFDPDRPVVCPGWFTLPGSSHQFRDWKKGGHGAMNLHDAVVQSCDVYFYKLAVAMNIDGMKKFLAPFGFGKKTGVDLFNESEGILPSLEWKAARKQTWYPGETVITGIGQGSILLTPLQLADAIAALANQGVRMKPQLVSAIVDAKTQARRETEPVVTVQIPLKDRHNLDIQIQNLTDVVHTNRGTAYGIGHNSPYKIAGKTGTAQVKSVAQGQSYSEKNTLERYRDHALFVSFAPVGDPKVAVSVIVENGGHGSSTAAPIARKLMDYLLLGKTSAPPGEAKPAAENDE